ncbi:uncharacterized protein PAC_13650 [Phialocephala subalpina]|uniref:Rhodopsin domain-containing protein n=1 Tax=Phialocephala subalpina TaxID=576137 RepID=A0A1L7XFE6_9HELO|nr:uncharacterized protein PAC_13650 [Phialocephala subalpina]
MATNRAPEVDAVAGLFLSLTWITTALRCYVKGFMAKSFGLEDWLAIVAQLCFTLTAILVLEGISHSMGMHLIEIELTAPQNLQPAMMYWFAVELAYTTTTCFLKLSIALFLLRIATKSTHRILLYSIMTLASLLTIAYFLFLVFQCHPVSYFMQFGGETGSCLAPEIVGAMTYTHSGVNAFCDVVLALLPVVIVSQLQMNIRTKLTVSTILSMGIMYVPLSPFPRHFLFFLLGGKVLSRSSAAIAVIIRIPYVRILVNNASDFLYSSTDVVIWTAIEPGLAITAANMATLRPLFSAFLSRTKLWGSTTARGKSFGYGHSKSRSRGLSGNSIGLGGRKGYIRSGSKGNISTTGFEGEGDEVGLNDLISSRGDGGSNEKVGRERGNMVTVTVEGQDEGSVRSHNGSDGVWDLEQGHTQIRQSSRTRTDSHSRQTSRTRNLTGGPDPIGEWPVAIRKTVQTHVTSWIEEDAATDGQEVPVSMKFPATMQKNGTGDSRGRRRSVQGATSAGW